MRHPLAYQPLDRHLEVLEIETEAKEVREGVPSEEEVLREPPCPP
jgi:hypothetical protein